MVSIQLSLLVFTLSALYTNALITSDVPVNYTHVCHSERFQNLGLDISDFAYCDKSLSSDVRVKDLIGRMTLSEKIGQMGEDSLGVPRIGLSKYRWWSEILHGVATSGPGSYFDDDLPSATSFPTPILTTASFNRSLWKTITEVLSTEARAMYNSGHAGLTFWSPVINVVRDPRWGRIMETPGEDPFVVGTWAVDFIRGLQDIKGTENFTDLNLRPLKVSGCCKHYTAYDLESWHGIDRLHFDARVTAQDMIETFQPPFEMCVREGDGSSLMCSFNRVNGFPTCADSQLLKGIVRGEWNLHGYIVADCDSVEVIVDKQKWLGGRLEDAVSQVLRAGLDLDCGDFYLKGLESAVSEGQVKESDIDNSLKNLYTVLLRLGFFDGSPYFSSLGKQDICTHEHIELAKEAAREGIVLLKNDNDTLPLTTDQFKKLAVVGPHANATKVMLGNYAGIPCRYMSPIDGFSAFGEVTYEMGCGEVACKNDTLIFRAMQAAKNADATIVVVGLDTSVEAEWVDREDLLLPGYQSQLVTQVAEISTGPVILVILSAGGVDVTFAKKHPKIQSILWAGYPGEEGGSAIADVVFGKYNPGGRLPITWYETDYVNQLPMTSMKLRPDDSLGYPGRTYKFFNGSTVYPFAYGMSYTQFQYSLKSSNPLIEVNIKLAKHQVCRHLNHTDNSYDMDNNPCPSVPVEDLKCEDINYGFRMSVQNVGERDGSEVVMVYSKPPEGISGTHSKQVIGFERVFVKAGESKDVKFTFNVCKSLAIVDAVGYKLLPSGSHTILLGESGTPLHVKVGFNH